MPRDAACWWEVSQVNLSILLSSRYPEYVTVQILLIATCKKDWGYSNSCLNVKQIHIWTSWLRWRFFDCDDIHFVYFLFFDVWGLFLQIKRSYVNQEGYMFMPFDAAHWCAVSQVNLSLVLCLRYHEHVTVRILLIASCKKDQGYSVSSLNLTQIHIWTS